jgi:hypothetical protein
VPLLPEPESPAAEPVEGGGGITLLARRPPFPEPPEFLAVPELDPVPMEGGGGTMFASWFEPASDVPGNFLEDDPVPADPALVPDTEGGGAITPAEP